MIAGETRAAGRLRAFLRWLRRLPGWPLVAFGGVLAIVWFFYWSVNTHVFQDDEDQYVYLSRWLWNDFPASLWNFDVYARGLQRLEIWLIAVPALFVDSPWSMGIAKLLNTIAFVSTAIPVYLLGRGVGLSSRWAALPALLSAVVPWAVVTTGFLTENLAYPAFAWVLYTAWRASNRAGTVNDLLALGAILVAGLSRSALLVLAPLLPLTIVVTGLRCGTGSLAARLKVVLRQHVVLWIVIAVAAAALLLGAGSRVAGGYGTPWNVDLVGLMQKSGRYFSRTVIGTGFFAAAAGVPWLVVALVRTREPERFAFAFAALAAALLVFYSLGTAGADERYIVYLAPLVLLSATVALARREVTPVGLAAGSILAAVLVLRQPWNGVLGDFGYFVWPVEMVYGRTGLRLDHYLPGDSLVALRVMGMTLGLAGMVLALVLWRAPGRISHAVAVATVAIVAVAIVVQTQYSLSNYVNSVGGKSGPSLKARAWVDSSVPRSATVAQFASGIGQRLEFEGAWREVQFYNQRIETVFALGGNSNIIPIGDTLFQGLTYNDSTGLLNAPPLTDYLVVAKPVEGPHLRGIVVRDPAYLPVALIQPAKPASMAWAASGFAPDGRVAGTGGAAIRIYGGRCATFDVLAPPDRRATWRLASEANRNAASGELAPGIPGSATVPLGGGTVDLRFFGDAQLLDVRVDSGCS